MIHPEKLTRLSAIAAMRREGVSCAEIGKHFGMTRSSVCRRAWEAREAGFDTGPRPLLPSERLKAMPVEDYTQAELAAVLGVSRATISVALAKIGRVAKRAKIHRKPRPPYLHIPAHLRDDYALYIRKHIPAAEARAALGIVL